MPFIIPNIIPYIPSVIKIIHVQSCCHICVKGAPLKLKNGGRWSAVQTTARVSAALLGVFLLYLRICIHEGGSICKAIRSINSTQEQAFKRNLFQPSEIIFSYRNTKFQTSRSFKMLQHNPPLWMADLSQLLLL
jgi:hypothetical protein